MRFLTAAYNGQGEFVKEVQYNFAPAALYRWILNDSTVLCKTLVDNNTRVVREVLVNGTDRTPGFLSELDKAKVQTENDGFVFNTLGTLVEYNPELDVVAEVSLHLDVINLYSLHSNYHESIQIGKKPVLISDIEALMKSGIYDCSHVKETVSSESSFSLLYRDSAGDMSILQFGWDGKPLSRISLPENVSSLDIHGKDFGQYQQVQSRLEDIPFNSKKVKHILIFVSLYIMFRIGKAPMRAFLLASIF